MHNRDDKYPARPGFEPDTSRLQAPFNANEPRTQQTRHAMLVHRLRRWLNIAQTLGRCVVFAGPKPADPEGSSCDYKGREIPRNIKHRFNAA